MITNTGNLLVQIGIFPNIKGFYYFVDAVEIINNATFSLDTIKVYSKVAELNNTTGSRVERAMRHAIESMYSNIDIVNNRLLDRIIGSNYSCHRGKPTNGQFMFTLAKYCKDHHIKKYTEEDAMTITKLTLDSMRIKYLDMLLAREFPEFKEELERANS